MIAVRSWGLWYIWHWIVFRPAWRLMAKDMEHILFRKIVICLPEFYWLINWREPQKVLDWRALTWWPCTMLTNPWCIAVTELFSLGSITIHSENFLNVKKLLLSLHIGYDTLESITDLATTAVLVMPAARAQAVEHQRLQFLVPVRPAEAVAFFTSNSSIIGLKETQSTLLCTGSSYWKQMRSSLFPPFPALMRFLHASVILVSFLW